MRNRFDNQLAEMNNELISMGALCENAIASAVKALLEGDIKLAAAAIRIDQEIDRKEREIESMCCLLYTSHRQPEYHGQPAGAVCPDGGRTCILQQ